MSDVFEEFAVYWVPSCDDSLGRFGGGWTGWCADRGESVDRGRLQGVSFDIRAIAGETCRHGLHAVIKAPFHLSTDRSRFALEHALAELAETVVAFSLPPLHLAVVGGRVSLVPGRNCRAAAELVAQVGNALDRLDDRTLARGFTKALPPAFATDGRGEVIQLPPRALHSFHMPLTDPLEVDTAFAVLNELKPLLRETVKRPRTVRNIALMGDPGAGRPLRLLLRYRLRDAPARPATRALPCIGPTVLVPMLGERQKGFEVAL